MIKRIAGHEDSSVTFGIYGSRTSLKAMAAALQHITDRLGLGDWVTSQPPLMGHQQFACSIAYGGRHPNLSSYLSTHRKLVENPHKPRKNLHHCLQIPIAHVHYAQRLLGELTASTKREAFSPPETSLCKMALCDRTLE